MKDILALQQHKKVNEFDIEKTKNALDSFDLKIEQYKKSLNNKMDNFNPLEFDLLEKESFKYEKEEIYSMIKLRCEELQKKVRNLEKYAFFVKSINDEEDNAELRS